MRPGASSLTSTRLHFTPSEAGAATAPAADAAGRLRQMRFLAGRGFAPEVIRKVVGGRDDE